MKFFVPILPVFVPVFLLTACHGDSTPGAATPAEAQQLNDAAAMLDANSVDTNAISFNASEEMSQ